MRIITGVLVVGVLALAGCGSDDDGTPAAGEESSASPPLGAARDACESEVWKYLQSTNMVDEAAPEDFMRLADDEQTLTVGNAPQGGDRSAPVTIPAVACVLRELDAPSSVMAKMEQTRALDGQQGDEWEGVEVTWTYHPDDGVSAVFTDQPG